MGQNIAKTPRSSPRRSSPRRLSPKRRGQDVKDLTDRLVSDAVTTIQDFWYELGDQSSDEEGSEKDVSDKHLEIGFKIYKRLFAQHPHYRNLFQDDLESLVKRIIMMITTVVDGLDDLEKLKKSVYMLGKRHAKYGVPEEAFGHFIDAIMWGMKFVLGDEEFTPRIEFCFRQMFDFAAKFMITAVKCSKRKSLSIQKHYNVREFAELQDFGHFLEHPLCLEFFHLYLSTTFSEESILFYIDVMKFKKTEVSIGEMEATMKNLAKELFDKYIHEDGATPVNIPYTVADQIQGHLDNPTAEMYDLCVKEIQGLLHRNKWLPFLDSNTCQALCACLAGDVVVADVTSDAAYLALMTELSAY